MGERDKQRHREREREQGRGGGETKSADLLESLKPGFCSEKKFAEVR